MVKTKLFPQFPDDKHPKTVECRHTKVGVVNSCTVSATTDAAGAQVVVKGEKIHLLSKPLKNHRAAVALAKNVVANGIKFYPDWIDIKNNAANNLFALFGGMFRNTLR